jgi:hypothetical protein
MIDRRLAEDVLFAFSVEPQHDRQTLENYLRRYPELAEELIDLSHEFRLVAELGESEIEVADGEGRPGGSGFGGKANG